jgi:hypothetical protein
VSKLPDWHRDRIRGGLTASGVLRDIAESWCDAWEHAAAIGGLRGTATTGISQPPPRRAGTPEEHHDPVKLGRGFDQARRTLPPRDSSVELPIAEMEP